jgi:hypothetical protein
VLVTVTPLAVDGPALRGAMRKPTLLPATVGEPVVTTMPAISTSAPGITVVLTDAVLSLVSGSAVPPASGPTEALLVTVPLAAFTVATRVTGGMGAPTACGPLRVQLTTPALWPQVQPPPDADTKLVDGDRLLVRRIAPVDVLGPPLATVIV